MATDLPTELESFQHFLQQQIKHGQKHLTPEESLRLFRAQQREFADTVAGIRRGVESIQRGEQGIPLEEADAFIRRKYNIPQDA
jgi:hypothetical protein